MSGKTQRRPLLRDPGRTLFRLLLASFAVGVLLTVFDLRPEELLRGLGDYAHGIFSAVVEAVRWAIPYVLLGAVVVAPIWLALALWRYVRGRG